ncbi:MAG: hypothetical protein A3C43_07455 [Candidatus Schekmanbacteria bacterium RIFCSPHIGHO2_02_FULL_38_11]|uniref:Type II secretion system protein J n=1 Tax=Candidatus Schekmanbacteria bacterium RIFCSPLOWO2_12_FULL_38_15 TaxID=1817883 RepID=A0A1F7SKI1_9BACT|nr:MAG: hypothetical protein A2043_01660 [Candidatus Schekmanbacteria bacterium GWA2_38_9]OGL47904.1 MAG: hypothetical protein A3H37_11285 [Candidatus Schekmanbacteria bacterium RIFCSPLOWO2_02_FULL_38_14]OGL53748.1 MAG: hypothetical protein A3G31_03315 [Candidatus Schekmanbacteria bacterium RIFCSPLOWO2_12_FULL_38_15]OGL55510.1 MAG: hypothetical protein A3C43_07455 [Candidatus Schekmanbacteria bacterium RIFCSPHIGHO2_02_FULL_38_11]
MKIKNQKSKIKITEGFTLLELVVAIAIFAIISTFVYGAYTGTVSTTERAQKKIEFYQKARLVLSRISEEIEQAAPPREKGEMPDFSYFSGSNDEINGVNADELRFVSRADSGYSKESGKPAIVRITYRIEVASGEGNEYYVLIRKEDPIFFREDEEREKTEEFLEKCEGINFEYYSDEGWVNEWDDQTSTGVEGRIPKAVRITLTLKDDEDKPRDFSTTVYLPQGG